MIKVGNFNDVDKLKDLPQEVIDVIREITIILDYEYGTSRDIDKELGGYILIIESKEELLQLKKIYMDINNLIPEYVDKIITSKGETWINALILLNNDFGVTLMMKEELAPKILLEEIV